MDVYVCVLLDLVQTNTKTHANVLSCVFVYSLVLHIFIAMAEAKSFKIINALETYPEPEQVCFLSSPVKL
jgi:hypothetical protein